MTGTAFVTGAAKRVGRAVALELASRGFDVGIHYRSSLDKAEAVAKACKDLGGTAWTVQADLAAENDVLKMAEQIRRRWKSLDVLVHNASLFEPVSFDQISTEQWDEMLAVNLRAPFLLSRECLSLLQSDGGLVVHLCDIGGDRPMPGYAHYSVSKSGLIGLVKAMAVELGPSVRTVGISPGHVAWPEEWSEETRKAITARIPLGRVGTPEDVAKLVGFLWSDGGYINGDIINVDGGLASQY